MMIPYFVAVALLYKNTIHASAAIVFANNEASALETALALLDPSYTLIASSVAELQHDIINKLFEANKNDGMVLQ